jgi:LPXTG-motif cell wall-anchored protein
MGENGLYIGLIAGAVVLLVVALILKKRKAG